MVIEMGAEYFIVDKTILPDYFDLVLRTKSLVEDENKSVSLSCKETGISRSTFYKYKDKIFKTSASYGKKAIINFKLFDRAGVLGSVIHDISTNGGNIISVNSTLPVNNVSIVTIVVDVKDLKLELQNLIKELKLIKHVKSVGIVAVE